jgi:hypothetical protein
LLEVAALGGDLGGDDDLLRGAAEIVLEAGDAAGGRKRRYRCTDCARRCTETYEQLPTRQRGTMNFLLSDTCEPTENQLGLIFASRR